MDFFDVMQQEAERVLADPNTRKSEYLDKFVQFPDEGEITVRILPPSHGLLLPFVATRLHKLDGKSFHCRKELQGTKWVGKLGVCPVCDHYNWLWNQANQKANSATAQQFIDIARRIKPIERYYYNCIVRDDPKQEGNKVLSIGKTLHQEICIAYVGNPKSKAKKKLGRIDDVTGKEGRDFLIVKSITKSGAERYPNYKGSQFLDLSPLGDPDQVKEWLANCYNLAELRVLKTPEELKLALKKELGLIASEDTGYDPREYQMSSAAAAMSSGVAESATVHRNTTAQKAQEAQAQAIEEPPFDMEEAEHYADTDFMAELNEE